MNNCRDCAESRCICPHAWAEATLILPATSPLAVEGGKWERLPDGRLQARYTPHALWLALKLAATSFDSSS